MASFRLPQTLYFKICDIWQEICDLRIKLQNISQTNHDLGVYHLNNNNLNDAIIRFKLLGFISRNDDFDPNGFLAWCYFLKNNVKQALRYSQRSASEIDLHNFLSNYPNNTEIKDSILQKYRDLSSNQYITKFDKANLEVSKVYLPQVFVRSIIESINILPKHYTVLELGSNVGVIGSELRKRLPDSFDLVGVENSQQMIRLVDAYYPNHNPYDQLYHTSVRQFLDNKDQITFDLVISCCGISFQKDLSSIIKSLCNLVNASGYISICVMIDPDAKDPYFSLKHKEFVYTKESVQNCINHANIKILSSHEFTLDIHTIYYSIVGVYIANTSRIGF